MHDGFSTSSTGIEEAGIYNLPETDLESLPVLLGRKVTSQPNCNACRQARTIHCRSNVLAPDRGLA